ncbi:MAG: DUF4160 domain-containing protein [Caldilineaceae bacterium]
MPEIARFYGVAIYLYFERTAQHHEPHFHATYGEYDASFAIDPPLLLAGDLPRRQQRLVLAWAELHQAELLENWHRAIAGQRLLRIEGLR